MSGVIDQRIVQMAFDNKQFESNASQTMSTLGKLRESLNFSGAGRGLNDLQNAAGRADFSPIASAVDGISLRFVAMSTVAITAISNVVSRAVDAGVSIGKSLSLDQITTGFAEYETNINSIQTILANTKADGTTLTDVTASLDELNTYADDTIYNFSEMAKNIGTFTAAGVDLQTATGAIKGIANLAAISGSNSQQAATAMYQLSQAIASGSVKLMDWNSVVNAGMGGEVFQRALYDTGIALGTITNVPVGTTFEEWNKKTGSFRNTLSEAQLAAEATATAQADAAKTIKDAQDSASESVAAASKRMTDAQEAVADSAKQAAEDMADAVKAQQEAQERAAESVKQAFEDVIDARDRLNEALKPASERDLEEASDRLRIAQLDQTEGLKKLTGAQKSALVLSQDLSAAEAKLLQLQASGASSEEIAKTQEDINRAKAGLTGISSENERAIIGQKGAIRTVKEAEEALAEIKAKGTEQDQRVIDSRQQLADTEKKYTDAQLDAQESILKAAERIADVSEQSAERRASAIESLNEAERNSAKVSIKAQEQVADAHKRADEIIKQAAQGNAEPPGWVTDDVLTTALRGIAGEFKTVDEAIAAGFSPEAAQRMKDLGELGTSSARDVKTATQLFGTLKESIGSGWAQSFRAIFGNFEQAKELFTSLSDTFGEIVNASSESRNTVLNEWATNGGRQTLIDALNQSMALLGDIIKPIQDAFRNVFPLQTAENLKKTTEELKNFITNLRPSEGTISQLTRIFTGLFAILRIGWEVIKETAKTIGTLFDALAGDGRGSAALEFFASIGDKLSELKGKLVTAGGIAEFFDKIRNSIRDFINESEEFKSIGDFFVSVGDKLQQFGEKVKSFFSDDTSDKTNKINKAMEDLRANFGWVSEDTGILSSKWEEFRGAIERFGKSFNDFAENIKAKLSNFWEGLLNFDVPLDLVNTGLIAGIFVIIKKFIDALKNSTLGDAIFNQFGKFGDLLGKVGGILDAVKDKMKAMTLEIKAKAVMKIAAAIAILALSLLLLSSIDSGDLTKATVALGAVATIMVTMFGQLAGIGKGTYKLPILASSLMSFAFAIGILTKTVANLSELGWEDLTKGILATDALLGITVRTAKQLAENEGGFISAGVGLVAIAGAIGVLALSVKFLSTLNWEELGKGLLGVIVLLGTLTAAVKLMEVDKGGIFAAGAGLIGFAIGIGIMAVALKILATITWEDMAKGLLAIGLLLAAVTTALKVMDSNQLSMTEAAVSFLLLAGSILILAIAMRVIGSMSWEDVAKGLVGIGAALIILTVAAGAMTGTIAGAAAMVIMVGALWGLTMVMVAMSRLSWGDILKAIVGLAAGLLVLALAAVGIAALSVLLSEAVPFIIAFGGALLIVSVAILVFAAALFLVAVAIGMFQDAGAEGISAFGDVLQELVDRIPELIEGMVVGLIKGFTKILEESDKLVDALVGFAGKIINGLTELVPELGKLISALIDELLRLINAHSQEIIDTGWALLMNLLHGIEANIEELVTVVSAIIEKFFTELSKHAEDIIRAGALLLAAILSGFTGAIETVVPAVAAFFVKLFEELGKASNDIVDAGADMIIKFLIGVALNVWRVVSVGRQVALSFMNAILSNTVAFVDGAFNLITNFLNELADVIRKRGKELREAGKNLLDAILEGVFGISKDDRKKIGDFLVGLFRDGVWAVFQFLQINSPSKVFIGISKSLIEGFVVGINKHGSAVTNSMVGMASDATSAMQKALNKASFDIENSVGASPTITPVMDFTQINKDVSQLTGLVQGSTPTIAGSLSLSQANTIASTSSAQREAAAATQASPQEAVRDVTFIQNNNSPKALSTGEIYRGSKSQINLLKQELGIP